jgi:hypothetical protein
MTQLLRFSGSVRRDPAIGAWMKEHDGELGEIARRWFEVMRGCGAALRDPNGLLQGSGKFRRHVKLKSAGDVDPAALQQLIEAAYADMKKRVWAGE